jgi:HAMP domain-containing protein
MNRLKLWVFVALAVALGAGNAWFLSGSLTQRALGQIDRELNAGVTQVDARVQLLAADASRLADALARDPGAGQALSAEGTGDAAAAAQTALASALRGTGEEARPLLVLTSSPRGRTLRVNGAEAPIAAELEAILPSEGRREAFVAAGDGVFYAVGVPAGRAASVAVGVPLSGAWLQAVRAATGCEVTLAADGQRTRSTLGQDEAARVAAAARGAVGRAAGIGRLPPQRLGFDLPLGPLPLPFAEAPAQRVQAVALKGLPGGLIALSQATAPALAPLVSYLWTALAALALLALLGFVLGLLVTNEQRTVVPSDLVAVADRLRRGDFSARAPVMAGSLGTLAGAMNRAAEAAQATATAAAEPAPAAADSFGAAALAPEPAREPPVEPLESAAGAPAEAAAEPALAAPPASAAAAPEPPPPEPAAAEPQLAEPMAAAELPPPAPAWDAAPPGPLYAPAAAAPAAEPPASPAADSGVDEEHWRAVYDEFVRVRAECGEPANGIGYDRFRQKLQKNHEQLVQKYACRTVRFQVYVKAGKAAIKASPVR